MQVLEPMAIELIQSAQKVCKQTKLDLKNPDNITMVVNIFLQLQQLAVHIQPPPNKEKSFFDEPINFRNQ